MSPFSEMEMVRTALLLVLAILIPSASYSNLGEVRPGARSQGMGGCSVALPDGAEGIFVNPAFLAELWGAEVFTNYRRGLSSQVPDYFQGAVARRFQFGGLGLGIQGKRGSDSPSEDGLILSYGRFLPYYIASLGLNAKVLSFSLQEAGTAGGREVALCFDLALLFRFLNLSIGYAHHNFLGERTVSTGQTPEAARTFGLSYRFPQWAYWSLETSSFSLRGRDCRAGAEIWIGDMLAGRVGVDGGELTGGLGVERKKWSLNLAGSSEKSCSVSFQWRFGRRFFF